MGKNLKEIRSVEDANPVLVACLIYLHLSVSHFTTGSND